MKNRPCLHRFITGAIITAIPIFICILYVQSQDRYILSRQTSKYYYELYQDSILIKQNDKVFTHPTELIAKKDLEFLKIPNSLEGILNLTLEHIIFLSEQRKYIKDILGKMAKEAGDSLKKAEKEYMEALEEMTVEFELQELILGKSSPEEIQKVINDYEKILKIDIEKGYKILRILEGTSVKPGSIGKKYLIIRYQKDNFDPDIVVISKEEESPDRIKQAIKEKEEKKEELRKLIRKNKSKN